MTTMTPTIRSAGRPDLYQVAATLAEAFLDSPDGVWLIPDRAQRATVYADYCPAMATVMYDHGAIIDVIDGPGRRTLTAAAVWLQAPMPRPMTPTEYATILDAVGDHAPRFETFLTLANNHATTEPHYELAWLGVRPEHWCNGLGSALLAHRHRIIDERHLPCRLISTSGGARDLYQRHGYRTVATYQLPPNDHTEQGTTMWIQYRPAA